MIRDYWSWELKQGPVIFTSNTHQFIDFPLTFVHILVIQEPRAGSSCSLHTVLHSVHDVGTFITQAKPLPKIPLYWLFLNVKLVFLHAHLKSLVTLQSNLLVRKSCPSWLNCSHNVVIDFRTLFSWLFRSGLWVPCTFCCIFRFTLLYLRHLMMYFCSRVRNARDTSLLPCSQVPNTVPLCLEPVLWLMHFCGFVCGDRLWSFSSN